MIKLKKQFYLPLLAVFILILGGILIIPRFLGDTFPSSSVKTKSWSGSELLNFTLNKTQVVNNNLRLASLSYKTDCKDYTPVLFWGTKGNGDGQFQSAKGIAIRDDNVYVLDAERSNVQRFSKNGERNDWNLINPGLNNPSGISLDEYGTIFIADTGNNMIKAFNSDGTLKRQWGGQGSDNGKFNYPAAIAIDSNNNIYIADSGNNRIQKFSNTGDFISKWGTLGNGDGQFENPTGIIVDSAGNIFIADTNNQRIERFSSSGAFIAKWGTGGNSEGSFSYPSGLAVNNNYIFVSDTMNNRIEKFDKNGLFVSAFGGFGAGSGLLDHPGGLALDSENFLFVVDSTNNRIQKFGNGYCFVANINESGAGDGQVKTPTNLALDRSGNLYIADTGNSRLEKVGADGVFIQKWSKPNGGANFIALKGLAVGSDGKIYISDASGLQNRVTGMDSGGNQIYTSIQFSNPNAVSVDQNGNAYVADTSNGLIKVLSSNGTLLTSWGSKGTGSGQLDSPSGIYVDSKNSVVYVADTNNHRIQKFSLTGSFISSWGVVGSGNGQFLSPKGIAADSTGNIYVVDSGNKRIQSFKPDGTYLFAISGNFANPYGIAIGAKDDIYISDVDTSTIKKYSKSTNFQANGTAALRGYDSGINGTVWKNFDWAPSATFAAGSIRARLRASDNLEALSNAPWSDYVTSNTAQLSSNGSSVFGRYAEIEFFLSLISGQTTPSLTSLSVTYNDYLSGIVYADSNIPVPANIKVIMQVNGTIKGSTTTDRDGRYHFGNLGVKNGDNIKLYLESDDYAGAISASATNRENLNLNMYGRKIVKPVDPINPTTSPGITPSSPTPPSVSPVVNKPITEVNVYRLRNKKSLRYFYTSFDSEKNQAVASGQWKLEGTLGKAYTGQAVGTIPIFRLYNTGNKVYLLTGSEFEKNQALAKNKNFKFEGVSFYAYPDTAGGNKPMYRFCYRYLGGVYYYTISSSEAKSLKKKFWLWRYEGIGFKLK